MFFSLSNPKPNPKLNPKLNPKPSLTSASSSTPLRLPLRAPQLLPYIPHHDPHRRGLATYTALLTILVSTAEKPNCCDSRLALEVEKHYTSSLYHFIKLVKPFIITSCVKQQVHYHAMPSNLSRGYFTKMSLALPIL
ncbi:uncharacterized protein [Ptychodera flava]|uniref:uncharacterized protein isoform X1 n=1 Tax=Ptychodera flava TaxID=63121 RepID=UPI003969BE68